MRKSKICFKCHKRKKLVNFYKHKSMYDGHINKCKECSKSDVKANYKKNRPHYLEYEKKRSNLSHRVEARKLYAKTAKGIEARRRALSKWSKLNRHKRNAHLKVNRAIKRGLLKRLPCFCGSVKSEAHHDDYSKPLDVLWLCSKHHAERHKNIRRRRL